MLIVAGTRTLNIGSALQCHCSVFVKLRPFYSLFITAYQNFAVIGNALADGLMGARKHGKLYSYDAEWITRSNKNNEVNYL